MKYRELERDYFFNEGRGAYSSSHLKPYRKVGLISSLE